MSFVNLSKEAAWKILKGANMRLQVFIPYGTVKKFPNEVLFLRHELDTVLQKFNKKIVGLEAEAKAVIGEESPELSEKQKIALVEIEKQKKKKEGGGGMPI